MLIEPKNNPLVALPHLVTGVPWAGELTAVCFLYITSSESQPSIRGGKACYGKQGRTN